MAHAVYVAYTSHHIATRIDAMRPPGPQKNRVAIQWQQPLQEASTRSFSGGNDGRKLQTGFPFHTSYFCFFLQVEKCEDADLPLAKLMRQVDSKILLCRDREIEWTETDVPQGGKMKRR